MEDDEEELYSEMQLEDGGRRRPSGTSHNALKVSAGALPPPTAVPTVPHPCSFGGLCSWLQRGLARQAQSPDLDGLLLLLNLRSGQKSG